jgi:hypothetical protein
MAEAFAERRLSYSTVRTLTRSATPETEAELAEDIAARQRAARSVKWRTEADGTYPSTAAQYADAMEEILDEGTGRVDTEVIFHVRGDGAEYETSRRTLVDELQLRCAPCHHRRHHRPMAG